MAEEAFDIDEILRASGKGYGLELFSKKEINQINLFAKKGKPYLKCFATSKERPAKPEEIVRQLYLWRLIHEYNYPPQRIALEKPVYFGSAVHEKAADIVIFE